MKSWNVRVNALLKEAQDILYNEMPESLFEAAAEELDLPLMTNDTLEELMIEVDKVADFKRLGDE